MKGIVVYWRMCGTNEVHKSTAVRQSGTRLVFDDDNWNPTADCFLTEEQCRNHHKLPPKEWEDTRKIVIEQLKATIEQLQATSDKLRE